MTTGGTSYRMNSMREFASNLIFAENSRTMARDVVFKLMKYTDLKFCAVYLKQQRNFNLISLKSSILLKLPSKINPLSGFVSSMKFKNTPLTGDSIPALFDTRPGLVSPLWLKDNLLGFIVIGSKMKGELTVKEIDELAMLSREFSLALINLYIEEYQKATEEKYKLLIEKERVESAFEISEAYRHELGNILSIIALASETLVCEGDYMPSRDDINTASEAIRNNIKRARVTFDAITSYNDKAKSGVQLADMKEIVEEVLAGSRGNFEKNNISFEYASKGHSYVFANGNLKDSLAYLLAGAVNAICHNKPEKRLIRINLGKTGSFAQLDISDTGNDATHNPAYKGVGIERSPEGGLLYFIARRTIFDHQGIFRILSFNEGRGTTVSLQLPLREKNETTPELEILNLKDEYPVRITKRASSPIND